VVFSTYKLPETIVEPFLSEIIWIELAGLLVIIAI
jgi:hypothetical protein